MEILEKFIKEALADDLPENDTPEMSETAEKAQGIYERLEKLLNGEEQKVLLELDHAYFFREGAATGHYFLVGGKAGFKLAVRLLLEALL